MNLPTPPRDPPSYEIPSGVVCVWCLLINNNFVCPKTNQLVNTVQAHERNFRSQAEVVIITRHTCCCPLVFACKHCMWRYSVCPTEQMEAGSRCWTEKQKRAILSSHQCKLHVYVECPENGGLHELPAEQICLFEWTWIILLSSISAAFIQTHLKFVLHSSQTHTNVQWCPRMSPLVRSTAQNPKISALLWSLIIWNVFLTELEVIWLIFAALLYFWSQLNALFFHQKQEWVTKMSITYWLNTVI